MDKTKRQLPNVFASLQKNIAEAEEIRRKRRLVYNLSQLEQGRFDVLKNGEFTQDVVKWLCSEENDEIERVRMLKILGEGIFSEELEMRERALMVYSLVTEWALKYGQKEIVSILAEKFILWLEFESEVLPGLEMIVIRIETLSSWYLQNSYWSEAEVIIEKLWMIQSGELEKNNIFTGLVNKSLGGLATKRVVEKIADRYLLEDENEKMFNNLLLFLGEKAATYLLNRVMQSPSRMERIALINLLPQFGKSIVPVLKDVLESNPPWGVLRNVIYIISEMKDESLYTYISKYFKHNDKRVQHEMICCVVKFGGNQMQKHLLEGLSLVDVGLKIYIIRILVEQVERDDTTFAALCELAGKVDSYPEDSREELLSTLIAAFKHFPKNKTVLILEKMLVDYQSDKKYNQTVFQIDGALSVLRPLLRHNRRNSNTSIEEVSFDADPVQKQLARQKVNKIEMEVLDLMGAGNSNQACELIYSCAVDAAMEKDFVTAEILRDRLLEVNPSALSEVIELGDLIEEHKKSSITGHHIEIWRELYDDMTDEQFTALYHALIPENYRKGDIIVQVGETDSSLYFLNSGSVSLSYVSNGRESFLKKMQPSDVLGSEQFFSTSVWTVTLKAFSEVQVQVLEYDALQRIEKDFPGLESILKKYCSQYENIQTLLEMSGDDRREYPRYPVSMMINNLLIDPFGYKGKRSFNGELLDVSETGLAFTIKITSNINARLLLGRQIISVFTLGGEEQAKYCGLIVGVKSHDDIGHEFSIHVKLSENMDQKTFSNILTINS